MHYKDTQLVNNELYSIRFLNEEVDSASFVLLGSWFQSIALLN